MLGGIQFRLWRWAGGISFSEVQRLNLRACLLQKGYSRNCLCVPARESETVNRGPSIYQASNAGSVGHGSSQIGSPEVRHDRNCESTTIEVLMVQSSRVTLLIEAARKTKASAE